MAKRNAAVHWVNEWKELKWNKYRLLPAEETIKTLDMESLPSCLVGSDSTWKGKLMGEGKYHRKKIKYTHHRDGGICQVYKRGRNLSILTSCVQRSCVP